MPEVDEKELEKTVNPIVQEYFEHGDTKEVQVSGQRFFFLPSGEASRSVLDGLHTLFPEHHLVFATRQMLLKELNLGAHKYEFSSLAVSLALEGKASHRELTSRLLSDLSGKLLSESDLARAFDKMLKELPDLMLDTPEAPQVRPDVRIRTHTFDLTLRVVVPNAVTFFSLFSRC